MMRNIVLWPYSYNLLFSIVNKLVFIGPSIAGFDPFILPELGHTLKEFLHITHTQTHIYG